jgi:hypothetical protein
VGHVHLRSWLNRVNGLVLTRYGGPPLGGAGTGRLLGQHDEAGLRAICVLRGLIAAAV